MHPFPLPENLRRACAASGPEQRAWLAALPAVVAGLATRWRLAIGPPFRPGGQTAWVAPARDARGRDLVLKVGLRHPEAEHEAAGLRAWHGRGAVRVHDAHLDGATSALLVERCRPGVPLGELRSGPERDEIVAALLRDLWHVPADGHPFRPLAEMCDVWADEFDEGYPAAPGALDPGVARAGMELFRGLPREPRSAPLLVTDLHAGNILLAGPGRWRLIDPKPHVGDPCYDVLQHLLDEDARTAADPRGAARRMAGLTGLDPDRVTLWLFARSVQECLEQAWLRPVATALAP